ncbi:MAG TPA: metallophosphoesterase, partial [Spirochaetes bacterium]|nr:metallophosphoesterase [Spirochaetota bacterium]
MKLAIISDTHFGDPMGTLVSYDSSNKPIVGPKYNVFREAAGKGNRYLILLGDIFDFSITSYSKAYEAGKVFFEQVKRDQIADEMIYIPGNHDADFWHTVEYEVNVIRRINQGKNPRDFRFSVPGFIDVRSNSQTSNDLILPDVTEHDGTGPKYCGLFLDRITEDPSYFNFAYPNVYMVTDNESVLITHGQYFEQYWAFASEWVTKLAPDALEIGDQMDLKEMVGINFPLSQLAGSGIGQAGPFTKVVRKVQRDIKDGQLADITGYLGRLDKEIDKQTQYPWYKQYLEWVTDVISCWARKKILSGLKTVESTRFDEEFIHKKEVQNRVKNFYKASQIEIHRLNQSYPLNIPQPDTIIFGHT